jgi:hypothetical protein
MAEIILPEAPTWRRATPSVIRASVDQGPSTGAGVTQTLHRLGTRWALTVECPPVREGDDWLAFQVALALAQESGAAYPWPQPGLAVGGPADVGTPVIRDAGQTGSTVILTGVNLSYQIKRGQFLSLLAGGRRYLYQCTATTLLPTATGDVAVPIFPMLRRSPDQSFAVELIRPFIWGRIVGDLQWTHETHSFVSPSFRIEEAR